MDDELERALRESEERYRTVVAAMAEGAILQDASATILAGNEAAERLLGLSLDQMMGRSSLDPRWRAIHEDGSPFPGETHPVPVTLRTGEPQRDVVMGVHKPDGSLTWLSVNSLPLFRDGETKAYATVCTFTDITQRKLTETALRESEERYRRIIEATLEGVWTIDLDGNTTFANRRMAEMLGCSVEELSAANMWDFVDESDRPTVMERMAARARGISEQHDFRLKRRDGAFVWTSMNTTPITFPDGRTGALAMVRDLSDARRMQAELRQSQEQLQQAQKLESVGRLAGGVAHDFNNLLTAILASVSLAESIAPDLLKEELGTVRAAAERGAQLTRQLLAFARRQVIQVVPLDLDVVIAGVEKVLRRLLGEHIELAIHLGGDLWTVRGDASWIEQVVINLAVNARDAMPHGGPVTISTRNATLEAGPERGRPEIAPGDYVVLAVVDAGTGIDEESLSHIFEPFYTSKSSGTGLGLASVYGIVNQLGGYATVTSAVGKGSRFEVYLPRAPQPEPTPPPPAPVARPAPGRVMTLLVVEDDDMLRRVTVRGLTGLGFEVLVASDAEGALAVAKEHPGPIHVMVTDVIMPRVSGGKLAEWIQRVRPETKVLFVSGYADELIGRHGVLEPGRHFLPKPYTIDELARRIDELVAAAPEQA